MNLFRDKAELRANCHQSFIGIWLHDDNLEDEEKHKMELCLTQTFNYYRIFIDMERFTSYIVEKERITEIFFIISFFDPSLYTLVDSIKQIPQTKEIYIFLPTENFTPIETFTPTTFKTNSIDNLFRAILGNTGHFINTPTQLPNVNSEIDTEDKPMNVSRNHEILTSSSKSILNLHRTTPIRHFIQGPITVLSFLTMITILLSIPYNPDEISEMWKTLCNIYLTNSAESDNIKRLESRYTSAEAIRYYTKSICLYRTVNQACRTENLRRIYDFRVYIRDLHEQLKNLHIQQREDGNLSSIEKVYRGKTLSGSVLQQLIDNKGGLISMNGFLSTTLSLGVSHIYAGTAQQIETGRTSVLFVLTVNRVKQPYANITSCSEIPDDDEVLFSLGPIWRIESIEFKETFYEIALTSSNDLDSCLDKLRENCSRNECNLSSVGDILRGLGNYEDAEWFYRKRLEQSDLSDKTRGDINNNLGLMHKEMGNNSSAIEYFKQAERSLAPSVTASTETAPSQNIYVTDRQSILIATYHNMGTLYRKNDNRDAALECYELALRVENGPRIKMAVVHENLSRLYSERRNDEKAQEHHNQAVKLVNEDRLCWAEFRKNLDRID